MNCVICKSGVTAPGMTNTMLERAGSMVIVKSIPAEICTQCGEAYFDEATTRALYQATHHALHSGVELEVIQMKAA